MCIAQAVLVLVHSCVMSYDSYDSSDIRLKPFVKQTDKERPLSIWVYYILYNLKGKPVLRSCTANVRLFQSQHVPTSLAL